MTYAIHGELDGSDVPKFLTMEHDFQRRYLPSLLAELQQALGSSPLEVFVSKSGLEELLVSEQLFQELKQQHGVRITNVRLVKAPNPASVAALMDEYVQRAKSELPQQYAPKAVEAIMAKKPRFAGDVREAATALGVALK